MLQSSRHRAAEASHLLPLHISPAAAALFRWNYGGHCSRQSTTPLRVPYKRDTCPPDYSCTVLQGAGVHSRVAAHARDTGRDSSAGVWRAGVHDAVDACCFWPVAHTPCVSVHLLLQRACDTATLSYCTGNVYTSLTGFCFENGAGNVQVSQQGVLPLACTCVTLVQLMATGGLLAERGFKFWDFGMEMPYVTPNRLHGFCVSNDSAATATKLPSEPPPSPARNSSRV
jgi:hypothetical protein